MGDVRFDFRRRSIDSREVDKGEDGRRFSEGGATMMMVG
jgi:hypothetical protein